jgi:hypothetical protein
MRRSRVLLVGGLALALGVGAASAGDRRLETETARLRAWNVTLTYGLQRLESFSQLRSLQLRAEVGGRTRLDRVLRLPDLCRDGGCEVLEGAKLLELADLGGAAPTAVIWLWTGGAHCCSVAETVPLDGSRVTVRNFGNPGAGIVKIDGRPLFASEDDRFSYLYTSYAASARPLELWSLRGGRFVDVTASYRGRVAKDAARLWAFVRTYSRRKEEIRGLFAAWAADACRLSGRARVEAAARPLVAQGAFSPPRTDPFGPTGPRFPVVLVRDLTRWGYCAPR